MGRGLLAPIRDSPSRAASIDQLREGGCDFLVVDALLQERLLFGTSGHCFVNQHYGDSVAHKVLAPEARVVQKTIYREVVEGTFVLWTRQYFEQFRI
jgi:hypothetical protein